MGTFQAGERSLTILGNVSFYKSLLLSGLSIGVLVLLPFIFRAKLPEFGEGLYASSVIYFKFNDLTLAFLVIPITTLLLKKQHQDYSVSKLLFVVLLFSVLIAVFVSVCAYMVAQLNINIPILSASPMLAVYVAICLVFSSAAYIVSMSLVKQKQHKLSAIAAALSLYYLLYKQGKGDSDLEAYFYVLYMSYFIYMIVALCFYKGGPVSLLFRCMKLRGEGI